MPARTAQHLVDLGDPSLQARRGERRRSPPSTQSFSNGARSLCVGALQAALRSTLRARRQSEIQGSRSGRRVSLSYLRLQVRINAHAAGSDLRSPNRWCSTQPVYRAPGGTRSAHQQSGDNQGSGPEATARQAGQPPGVAGEKRGRPPRGHPADQEARGTRCRRVRPSRCARAS